jgi:histidine phosphotransferase ChpT
MDDRVRLAELVSARLCHDLSGVLASLLGALELLTEDVGEAEAAAVALESAAALGRRLKLLRAAWAAGPEALDLPRLAVLAEALASRRISLDLSALPPATVFAPDMGRLVLNVLLLAADSLPRGGVLRLDGSATELIAHLEGPNAAWPTGLGGVLADEAAAWAALGDPRAVQAPMTALLARQAGLRLSMLMPSGAATTAPLPLFLAKA